MRNLGTIALVGLLVASVVLGYFLYQRLIATETVTEQENTESLAEPTPSREGNAPSRPHEFSESYLNALTEDERKVLELERSSEVMKANQDLFSRTAKTAEYLDVTACQPIPLVLKANEGERFQIKNNDIVEHTIRVGEFQQIIPANSTKTFAADFGYGIGTYAATCDEKDSGYIWVVQAQQSQPVE